MIKYLFAAASVIFLVAASSPSKADTVQIPSEESFPSSVGEVIFHHQMHIRDLGIKWVECHHQIDAKTLTTPHPDYLKSSWINCNICHNESEKIKQKVYTCSACHHTNPTNIADETLSAKVVIHKKCWTCHQVSTGKEASKGCGKCHSGKKTL
jgi:Zn finger protein HypA/HybF involved in hydrogenase expression